MATPGVDPQHRVREHLEAHPDRLCGLRQGMVGLLRGPRSAPAPGPATVSAAQSRGGAATARRSGSSTREEATWSAASPTAGRSSAGSAAGRGPRGVDGGSSLHGGGMAPSHPGRAPRSGSGIGAPPRQLVVTG